VVVGVVMGTALLGSVGACEDAPSAALAPTSSALASAAPKTAEAKRVVVDPASSKVTFVMDAALEKIHGDAPKSASGELFVDLADLTKTTGLIKIDLMELVLYQQQREDEKSEYGERKKSDLQNEHMRTWLQISPDAPEADREKNRFVEFNIEKVDEVSASDVMKMTGDERTITATVSGELRLHGRSSKKKAKIEAAFRFKGDAFQDVRIKTLEPVPVGLEEHDVKPRETFGQLAKKTLGALGSKVANEAPIMIEVTAATASP
jgi:hypothetical protein